MKIGVGDQFPDTRLEIASRNLTEMVAEVANEAADFVLNILELVSQELPRCEHGTNTLARRRFDVNRLEQTDTHHLGDPTRIMPIGLVELRRKRRLHVSGLNANDRQVAFRQPAIDMLRQHPGLQADTRDRKW